MKVKKSDISAALFAFDKACIDICYYFVKKYFCDKDTPRTDDVHTYAIGGDLGGVWEINDYYFTIGDMRVALANNIPKKTLFAWYDHCIEGEGKGNTCANLEEYYRMTKKGFTKKDLK